MMKLKDNIDRANTIQDFPEQVEKKKALNDFLLKKQEEDRLRNMPAKKAPTVKRECSHVDNKFKQGRKNKKLEEMYAIVNEMHDESHRNQHDFSAMKRSIGY